jgi:hypothetical protein
MPDGRYAPKLLPPTVSATTSRPTRAFKGTHTGERDPRLPARAHKPSLPGELPLMRQLVQVPTGSLDVWPKIFHSSVQSAAVKTTVSAAGLRHADSTACWISCSDRPLSHAFGVASVIDFGLRAFAVFCCFRPVDRCTGRLKVRSGLPISWARFIRLWIDLTRCGQKGNAGDGDDMGHFFGRPSQITSGRCLAARTATDRSSATGAVRSPQENRHGVGTSWRLGSLRCESEGDLYRVRKSR